MGDTYVPRFWPPFFTLAGSSTIFLGYFFSSTNTKTIFCGIKTTNSYRIRSFRPQISFFPRSFWVQFSAASGTPPSFFGPSTPPGVSCVIANCGQHQGVISSLSIAAGGKYYQKLTIPIFRLLQNFTLSGCFPSYYFLLLFFPLTFFWLGCYCSLWLCFSPGN